MELNKDYVTNFHEQAKVKKFKGHIINAIDVSHIEFTNTE